MTIRRILTTATATATAVAGAAAFTATGQAADAAPTLKVTGAYAYVDTISASRQKFVRVVFRTAADLPRRGDGALRAGVAIEGVNHSIGTAKRGTRCYTGAAEIKGGSIAALKDGDVVRKGAKLGRTFTVKFFTRDGQSVTKQLKLRGERRGDDRGRPLGC
jgi:hypothetical protein